MRDVSKLWVDRWRYRDITLDSNLAVWISLCNILVCICIFGIVGKLVPVFVVSLGILVYDVPVVTGMLDPLDKTYWSKPQRTTEDL